MKLLFNFFLFITLSSHCLYAFDVRVLLERYSLADGKKAEIKLSSQHGIKVSGIDTPIQGSVSIVCTDQKTIINNVVITDEWVQFAPAISVHHEKKIIFCIKAVQI